MPSAIVLSYSDDFSRNSTAGKIYSLLKQEGYVPSKVTHEQFPFSGTVSSHYSFAEGTLMPRKSTLDFKLKELGISLIGINVIGPQRMELAA